MQAGTVDGPGVRRKTGVVVAVRELLKHRRAFCQDRAVIKPQGRHIPIGADRAEVVAGFGVARISIHGLDFEDGSGLVEGDVAGKRAGTGL